MHSYKNGNPDAKEMDDSEALRYADEVGIVMPITEDPSANDQDAIAEQLQGTNADAQGEPEEETPPPKGKKTGGRKRKSEVEDVATPAATPASPAQKRRRASTKPVEEKEEPKKGRKKGKNA